MEDLSLQKPAMTVFKTQLVVTQIAMAPYPGIHAVVGILTIPQFVTKHVETELSLLLKLATTEIHSREMDVILVVRWNSIGNVSPLDHHVFHYVEISMCL